MGWFVGLKHLFFSIQLSKLLLMKPKSMSVYWNYKVRFVEGGEILPVPEEGEMTLNVGQLI